MGTRSRGPRLGETTAGAMTRRGSKYGADESKLPIDSGAALVTLVVLPRKHLGRRLGRSVRVPRLDFRE